MIRCRRQAHYHRRHAALCPCRERIARPGRARAHRAARWCRPLGRRTLARAA